jgi:putative copper resistance protein D
MAWRAYYNVQTTLFICCVLPPGLADYCPYFCMRLSQARWRDHAVMAMMRFSRYGHVAVAGVLATGIINPVDSGQHVVHTDKLWSHALDQMCAGGANGGNCVSEQVCSGATLRPEKLAGTTFPDLDDMDRSGPGRASAGGGQPVRNLGTLLINRAKMMKKPF